MSGTAPSNPAPGGHPADRGVEQTRLDGDQYGQAQYVFDPSCTCHVLLTRERNIIDENKDTAGGVVDRDIGRNIDAGTGQKGLSSRVDDILNQPGRENPAAESKGAARQEQGFKIGEEKDMHDLAQSKQP